MYGSFLLPQNIWPPMPAVPGLSSPDTEYGTYLLGASVRHWGGRSSSEAVYTGVGDLNDLAMV